MEGKEEVGGVFANLLGICNSTIEWKGVWRFSQIDVAHYLQFYYRMEG